MHTTNTTGKIMNQALRAPNGDPRLPAYVRLRDDLASRIGSLEWPADSAIPSENRLAKEYGVAVGTMRRAIELLVEERLLERRWGSGTFVRRPAFNADLFRFFHVHDADAGARVIPESRILSRELVRVPGVIPLFGTDECIRVERLRLWQGVPMMEEELHLHPAAFKGFDTLDVNELGPLLYPVFDRAYGVRIAAATDEVSLGTADAVRAARLQVPAGSPIAVIERVARDPNGRIVEWRRAYGRGDRFRYRVDIN